MSYTLMGNVDGYTYSVELDEEEYAEYLKDQDGYIFDLEAEIRSELEGVSAEDDGREYYMLKEFGVIRWI